MRSIQKRKRNSEPTLADLARAAGMAVSTVSRALRNSPNQSAGTCERVNRIAREIGYRPNPLLSAWMARVRGVPRGKTGRGYCIVLADSFADEKTYHAWHHLAELEEGAVQRAAELGCTVEHIAFNRNGMTPSRFRDVLHARGVSGVIVLPFLDFGSELPFAPEGLAVVAVGHTMTAPELSRVDINYMQIWLDLLKTLRDSRCRRPGFCNFVTTDLRSSGRIQAGYWTAARRLFGPPVCPCLNIEGDETPVRRQRRYAAWIKREKPDALVFNKQWLAEALASGFQGPAALLGQPKRPTQRAFIYMETDWRDIGAAAVDLVYGQMIQNITGIPARPTVHLVPGHLRTAPG